MRPTATIQQVRFELHAPNTPPARQLPERLSRLHHDQLAAVLAEELGHYPPGGPAVRLAQLVVVVPPLAPDRLEKDLPEALRGALRSALAALPAGSAQSPVPPGEPLDPLAYFLLHGALPWSASAPHFDANEALREALRYRPGALRELLRRVGAAEAVRQRLARQLSDATLGLLIGLLEPVHAPFIKDYIAQTLATHQRHALLPIPEADLRVVVYELVLADLLLRWHTSFARQTFLEKQLRGMAAHYNLVYDELLQRLAATLVGQLAPTTLTTTLQALQREAHPANAAARVESTPAASKGKLEQQGTTAHSALTHYLRLGYLPHTWDPHFSLDELSTELTGVLRQGRGALHRLMQPVGYDAAAYSLAHRFPLAISQQFVHLLAPGQTRAFLTLLSQLTTQARWPPNSQSVYEKKLWQEGLRHLLNTERMARPPGPVQRWLPQHPELLALTASSTDNATSAAASDWAVGPLNGAGEADPVSSGAAFFTYLLHGASSREALQAGQLQAMRQTLHRLLQQDAQPLLAFLRQHRASAPVLRHIGMLLDFDSLVALVTKARTARPWYLAGPTAQALAGLLANDTSTTAHPPQGWLRAAFLYFHLQGNGQPLALAAVEAWPMLQSHKLPARAVRVWLLRRLARHPGVAQVPFFAWLLNAASRRLASTGQPLGLATGKNSEDLASRTERPALQQIAASGGEFSSGQDLGQRNHVRGLTPSTLGFGPRQTESTTPFSAATGYESASHSKPHSSGLQSRSTIPAFCLLPITAVSLASFQASASWRPAGTRPAEAFELLLAHLLSGAAIGSSARRRTMFKLVLAEQPGALRAVLRRHGPAAGAMGGRLARLATFVELAQLVPTPAGASGQLPVGRRALAALDALAGADTTQVPAGLLFLKVAFLSFHTPASGGSFSRRDAQGQAARQRLPWRALLEQIARLRRRVPALAATSFFARLWAFTPGQPLAGHFGTAAFSGTFPGEQLATGGVFTEAPGAPVQAAGPASPLRTTQASAAGPPVEAAQEGLFYYLLHGQSPWWEGAAPAPAALRRTLAHTARQPLTQAFLKRHALQSSVRRRLAQLADFSLLHTLTAATGPGRQQRQLLRPAFARLDQLLRALPGGSQSRFHVFLREAYLAATLASPAAGTQLGLIRKAATAAGLSWRSSLHRVGHLLRQIPSLAADPFFALLLRHYLNAPGPRPTPRLAPAVATDPTSSDKATLWSARPIHLPASWQVSSAAVLAADILEHYLRTGQLPAAHSGAQSGELIRALLRAPDAGLRARLRPYLDGTTARHRLAAVVPSTTEFLSLLRWLAPAAYQALAGIVRDWLRLQTVGLVQFGKSPADLWVAVLALTSAKASLPAHARAAALVEALVRGESALTGRPPAGKPGLGAAGHLRTAAGLAFAPNGQSVPEALRLLRLIQRSHLRLFSYLAALLAALLKPTEKAAPITPAAPAAATPPLARPRPLMRPKPLPPELQPEAATYIANAGLVLVWPFLTTLFERLGYVAEKQFISIEQTTRAAYLLQFLATGEDQPPEHLLTLNKLLCGVGRTLPLVRELPLTDDEKATGESLLGALMAQWGSAFKNTSLAGLRETFLQRGGKLVWADDRVTLILETKTVDILLDQRPWSIALIKLPWMPLPLYVTWR